LRPQHEKARSASLGATSFGIQAIAVDPKHAGRGVGKALIEACEDVARRRGLEWIYLAVETNNTKAIQFYERQGWAKVTKGDFWNGHMSKCLVAANANRA
jgi:ribosomal protein S18 acetylase RimI-like enzyme